MVPLLKMEGRCFCQSCPDGVCTEKKGLSFLRGTIPHCVVSPGFRVAKMESIVGAQFPVANSSGSSRVKRAQFIFWWICKSRSAVI